MYKPAVMLSLLLFGAPEIGFTQETFAFTKGRWFNGESFERGTFYSVDGVLTQERPPRIDETINLKGGYVVPPFGEAHNHNVESFGLDRVASRYLKEGIFDVKNPNSLARDRAKMAGRINVAASIDATFSNGGLTASGGHPIQIAQRNIENGNWPEEDGEGGFYFTIDTVADLDAKWDSILAGRPDFIKAYLVYSEEFNLRKDDAAFNDWKGLNPALVPDIVRRAHTAGLRVSVHIETAADFAAAVAAGVDEINHMPGFRPQDGVPLDRYALSEEDARAASAAGVVVVTTLAGGVGSQKGDLHERNLKLLKKHGVALAIGSDIYRQSATLEANYLLRLGVFTNLEVLKMWCETTPKTIFPNRRIGHLKEGYEASFLVLDGNPLDDFSHTKKIRIRVKQGVVLPTP